MASAGAGPFPAAATAAAAVAGASAGSVFVKRAGDARARFVRVPVLVGDAVTDLAERASLKLDWHTSAAFVDLFLVPDGLVEVVQRNPAREADVLVDTNLCLATVLLADASIRDRSCLLARLSSPPAAAPGGGGGGSNAAAASGGFGGGFSGGGGGGGGGATAVGGGGGGFLSEAARAEMREVAFAAAHAVADEIVASRRSSADSLSSTRAQAPGLTADHLRDAMLAANRGPALIALGAGGQAGAAAGAPGAAAAEPGELEADSANNSSSSDDSKAPEFPSDVEGDVRDPQPKPGTGGGGGGGGGSGGSGGGSGDGGVGGGGATAGSTS